MTLERIGASISYILDKPGMRARMSVIGGLENEIDRYAAELGSKYNEGLYNEREVQMAIRVQIDLWSDEHRLTQHERVHLFRIAHRVAAVPQF